jgi:hypothetical protein
VFRFRLWEPAAFCVVVVREKGVEGAANGEKIGRMKAENGLDGVLFFESTMDRDLFFFFRV